MNLKSFLLAATVTVTLFSCRDIREGTADYAIIPLPQHTEVTPQTKPFILDKGTVIVTPENDNEMKTIAGFLNAYINECTGYNPQIEMFARFKMKSSFHKTKRII